MPQWKQALTSVDELSFTRLAGLSNICFKVGLKSGVDKILEPKNLIYREFKQNLVDLRIDRIMFEAKSADGSGPKLYFQNERYRIEGFFAGRPLSIWEMRNPVI